MDPIAFQRKRINDEAAAEISDAARLAGELQREFPGMKRSEALLEAERIQRERGLGWSVAVKPPQKLNWQPLRAGAFDWWDNPCPRKGW